MLEANKSYRVRGYRGTWSIIDTHKGCALLEHDYYGDETCYLLVKEDAPVVNTTIQEVIGETYDDIETACEDYDV